MPRKKTRFPGLANSFYSRAKHVTGPPKRAVRTSAGTFGTVPAPCRSLWADIAIQTKKKYLGFSENGVTVITPTSKGLDQWHFGGVALFRMPTSS